MYMDHDNDKRDMHDRSIDRSTRKYLPSPNNLVTIQCRCPTTIRSPTRAEPSPPSEVISCFVLFLCLFTTLALWLLFCVWMLCVNKYVCVDRQKCFDILPTVLSCIVLLYLLPTMVSPRSVLLLERRAPPVTSVAWRRVVRLVDSFRSLIVVHVYPTK